jgi:uncharacterized protein (TIGR03437 family)
MLLIYCAGLGAVDPPIPSGMPAPAAPSSRAVNEVLVKIGEVAEPATEAVLAPGLAGVYIVTAVVPPDVTPGDQVPVVLITSGQISQQVTMAVQ